MPPSTVFVPQSYAKILSRTLTRLRLKLGKKLYEEIGAILLTITEAFELPVAETQLQLARIVKLFSLFGCSGQDLDDRVRDFGSDYFEQLKRLPARTSIVPITVSVSSTQPAALLVTDYPSGSTSFQVTTGFGSLFATSGSVQIEPGTLREETITFTRAGDVFTVTNPFGFAFPHARGTTISFVALRSYLQTSVVTGATILNMSPMSGNAWPTSGFVVIARELSSRERIAFTRAGDVLTLPTGGGVSSPHLAGESLVLSTSGSDRSIPSGTGVFAKATPTNRQINYRTTAAAILYDGDLSTNLIPAESELPGIETLVGSNQLTSFIDSPFNGAVVTNPVAATRGRNKELDDNYRDRVWRFILSLSRSTPLALETLVLGLEDPVTGQTVEFAEDVEPVAPGVSLLYITDSTPTFQITRQTRFGREVVINDALLGDARGRLRGAAPYQVQAQPSSTRTPRLFRNVSGASGVATSVGADFVQDTTKSFTVNAYVGMWLKAVDGTWYQVTSNTAIKINVNAGGAIPPLGQYAIFDFSLDPLVPGGLRSDPGIDYVFNESNGDLELLTPLAVHESLAVADDGAPPFSGAYVYSDGLGALVQKAVNADRSDLQNFPGIKASGTKVLTVAPSVLSPSFIIQVIPLPNVSVSDLVSPLQGIVQAYVNSTGIGGLGVFLLNVLPGEVVLSEIVRRCKEYAGVYDVKVLFPLTNSRAAAGQLQRITAANVQIL